MRTHQERPRGSERLEVVGRVEPHHEHGEADEQREGDVDPEELVDEAGVDVAGGDGVVDGADDDGGEGEDDEGDEDALDGVLDEAQALAGVD